MWVIPEITGKLGQDKCHACVGDTLMNSTRAPSVVFLHDFLVSCVSLPATQTLQKSNF